MKKLMVLGLMAALVVSAMGQSIYVGVDSLSPSGPTGWYPMLQNDGTASIGSSPTLWVPGSARLAIDPVTGNGASIRTVQADWTTAYTLSDVEGLSYSYYVESRPGVIYAPRIQMRVGAGNTLIQSEPHYMGAVPLGTWVEYDAFNASWDWNSDGGIDGNWSALVAALGGALSINNLTFTIGWSQSGATAMVAYVDALTWTVDGTTYLFNFGIIPEPSTLALFGVVGLTLGGMAWKRRRAA